MTVEEASAEDLSAYGVCSRREAERPMTAGEVLVNGTPPPWATGRIRSGIASPSAASSSVPKRRSTAM